MRVFDAHRALVCRINRTSCPPPFCLPLWLHPCSLSLPLSPLPSLCSLVFGWAEQSRAVLLYGYEQGAAFSRSVGRSVVVVVDLVVACLASCHSTLSCRRPPCFPEQADGRTEPCLSASPRSSAQRLPAVLISLRRPPSLPASPSPSQQSGHHRLACSHPPVPFLHIPNPLLYSTLGYSRARTNPC